MSSERNRIRKVVRELAFSENSGLSSGEEYVPDESSSDSFLSKASSSSYNSISSNQLVETAKSSTVPTTTTVLDSSHSELPTPSTNSVRKRVKSTPTSKRKRTPMKRNSKPSKRAKNLKGSSDPTEWIIESPEVSSSEEYLFDESSCDSFLSKASTSSCNSVPSDELIETTTTIPTVPTTATVLDSLDSELTTSSISSDRKHLSSNPTSKRKRTPTKQDSTPSKRGKSLISTQNSTPSKRGKSLIGNSDPTEWITEYFQPPVVNEFSAPSGIQCNIDVTSTALECFQHFVDDEIIGIIVKETNRHANNLITSTVLSPVSRMRQWKDTTPSEIWEFLGLIMLMGMVRKPTLEMYFTRNLIYSTPIFGNAISKNRFLSILSNLSFSNNKNVTGNKQIHAIKSVADKISENFRKNYIPKEHVCVDQSLMLWKGRLGFKQYIPTKRARFGIKSYELCESRSGYVWNFLMYTGSSTMYTDDGDSQGEKVVMTLMEPLLGKNYKVYVDRFFSSPSLAERLLKAQTYMCGTVMKNRVGMPKNFPSEELKLGEMKACQKNGISVFAWKDQREVNMISTMSDNTFTEIKKKGRKTNEFIQKPTCVVQYNKYMGGVDLCDSLLHAYPSMRKSTKWYKKVFFHMIDICLYNAWVVYKSLECNISLFEFRHGVVHEMLRYHHVPRPVSIRSESKPLRLTDRHFPALNQSTQGKIVFRRCKVALCIHPCFKTYHTKLNF